MGVFTKKQKVLSAVAFNFNDYEELNYNQLLEVNGGCGGSCGGGCIGKRIAAAISVHKDDKYVISNNPKEEWRCDNFAKAIVEESYCDSSKNFAGAATKNTVQDHIDYGVKNYNLQSNDKKDAPTLKMVLM